MTLLAPFELHRSGSVAEATALIGEHGDEAVLYGGGTELLLVMKLGFAAYGHLVDIKPIAELSGIDVRDGVLRIGAAVTHRAIERSPLVARQLRSSAHGLAGAICGQASATSSDLSRSVVTSYSERWTPLARRRRRAAAGS